MEKRECLFSCGKINKYFIIPFLCPLFCFLTNYFYKLYIEIPNEKPVDEKIKKKIYFLSSTNSLSYFGGGLLYFITYIRSKTEAPKKSRASSYSSSSSIEYIYNETIGQKIH